MLRNPLSQIVFNTVVQSGGKILSVGLSAISILILTRYLGVSGYGNFSLVFAYLTFFLAFTDFGLQNTIVNKLSKKEIEEKEIFTTYLIVKIGIILLTIVVAVISLFFMPYSGFVKTAILFASVGVGIGALGGFGNTFFQHRLRVDLITILDIFSKLVTIIFLIIFSILELSFFYILSAVLISNVLTISTMFFYLRRQVDFQVKFNKKLAFNIFKQSAPIGIAGFLSIAYFKLDTIMLAWFRGPEELGFYSLAFKVFENSIIIWTFYMTSFFPVLSRFYHLKDIKNYRKILKQSIIAAVAFSTLILIVGYFLSPIAIRIFGGEDFSMAVTPLRILLFSSAFFFLNAIFYFYYFIKGRTDLIILFLVFSLVFNFILNLFIMPKYGYIGASFITVVTEAFLFLCYVLGRGFIGKNLLKP